jgi:hypothetical protein
MHVRAEPLARDSRAIIARNGERAPTRNRRDFGDLHRCSSPGDVRSVDHTLQNGNDTESKLLVAALCVGAAFSVAGALLARGRASVSSRCGFVLAPESMLTALLALAAPIPNGRPPTPLRV